MTKKNGSAVMDVLDPVSNDGEYAIEMTVPYTVRVTLEGVCPIIFHNYSIEAVIEKGNAAKNSKAKKEDNIESYAYRNQTGELCIPGINLKAACVQAARSRQDPRSPRKSAMELYDAIIVPLTDLASLGKATKKSATHGGWDFIDRRPVCVQQSRVLRSRPAMHAGWKATFDLMVTKPEYLEARSLHSLIVDAGRVSGLCDFRPTFGRFNVVSYEVITS